MRFTRGIRLAAGAAVVAAAVAGCSRSAQSYLERGNAQLDKGNVDAAVLEYRNAVEKDPMFAPARLKLADAYLRQGNGAGALGEAVRAADLLPNDAGRPTEGWLIAARGRQSAGRAGPRGQGASASTPATRTRWCSGRTLLAGPATSTGPSRKWSRPLPSTLPPSTSPTWALLQFAKGRREEAEAAFRQAVATDPESVLAQLSLAQFLRAPAGPRRRRRSSRPHSRSSRQRAGQPRHWPRFYLASNRAAEAEPYLKKAGRRQQGSRRQGWRWPTITSGCGAAPTRSPCSRSSAPRRGLGCREVKDGGLLYARRQEGRRPPCR